MPHTNPKHPKTLTTNPPTTKTQRLKTDDKIVKDKDREHRIAQSIKNGTFKIENFTKEVGANKCIFHGTSHPGTKKPSLECSKLKDLLTEFPQPSTQPSTSDSKPTSPPPSNTTTTPKAHPPQAGQATIPPHSVESTPQATNDEIELNNALNNLTDLGDALNNTNNSLIPYLTISAKSVIIQQKHNTSHTTVIDSGAFPMMFQSSHYFTELHPWTNNQHTHVTLADGTSHAPIQGIGTVRFLINNKFPVEFQHALFVPSLSTNLFSVKEFLRYQGTMVLG